MAGRLARMVAVVALLAAGLYFFVYLWRWEWNRALVAGVIFLAAEIGLSTIAVLDRIRRLPEAGGGSPGALPDPAVLARIQETAPPPRDYFAWLRPRQGQMGVFVPVLMGMGIVASALAWAVERLARSTARPTLERRLAAKLVPLSWPEEHLVRPREEELGILARPVRR